jgi:hypothetical protein
VLRLALKEPQIKPRNFNGKYTNKPVLIMRLFVKLV